MTHKIGTHGIGHVDVNTWIDILNK